MSRTLLCLLHFLAACAVSISSVPASERPNIVLIMADDIGVEGLTCYGGTSYRTPALDRLARDGVRFNHAYAQPLCTNTRVQLMTGLYNNRNWRFFGTLDPQSKTIGHYMQEAGYRTCIAGKWQLHSYDPPSYPGAERRRGKGMQVDKAGFDQYSLFHSWHTEDKGSRFKDPTFYQNGRLVKEVRGQYGPDHWVDFINGFIDQQTDSDQPFFVYYAMALPHRPFVPTPDSDDWEEWQVGTLENQKYFPDMVAYMDKCVGRVVEHLDESGLGEDTLVIFYSDNGTHQNITSQTVNGPVRGGKGRATDAGTHVPMMVRWTGKIEPGVNDNLVDSTDLLPTVREAAGQPIPGSVGLDGISFYPQLFGQADHVRPWVFCHFDPRPGWDKDQFGKTRFARDQRYKIYGDGNLFDIPADPLEQSPLAPSQDTDDIRQSRARLASVLDGMPNPDPIPREGDPRDCPQCLYVAAGGLISVFQVDPDGGKLSAWQQLKLPGAGPFTFAPNRRRMYAAAGQRSKTPSIATLDIESDGKLKLVHQADVARAPGYLMTDNNGEFLAGNHYAAGKASIWKIDPLYRGMVIEELTFKKRAHSTVFSPDNHWLLVPATGPNKVFVNHFMAQVGTSEPNDPPFAHGPTEPDSARQPRHLVFHPHLPIVYTSNERDQPGVGVWHWDTEQGRLSPLQNIVTQPADFAGPITTADLHLTPDARFLYVSNRDLSRPEPDTPRDSLVGFRVDPQTGHLQEIGHFPCERIPRSFTIDKLGKFIYVAGLGDGQLGVYRIEASGSLTPIHQYPIGDRPIWVETLSLP